MSELPGSAAVGIETVEWSAETGGNLTLRVTGRWRRRRPAATGQPTLVIEADGRRHRFPALPEPPSLGGTGPGVWRLSFTIPGWLAPDLGRTWLQFGTVIVPLPVAVPAPGQQRGAVAEIPRGAATEFEPVEPAPEPVVPAAGRPPVTPSPPPRISPAPVQMPPVSPQPPPISPPPPLVSPSAGESPGVQGMSAARPAAEEPGIRPLARPAGVAAELASRVVALERQLDDARAERARLQDAVAERERARRLAEQRAHAEQALRQDLARRLAESAREADRARQAMGELAAAEDRIRAVEEDLAAARRRSDEAEQQAAAAQSARERAEHEREAERAFVARQQQELRKRAEREGEERRRRAQVQHEEAVALQQRAARSGAAEAARLQFERELRQRRAGGAVRVPTEPAGGAPRPVVAEVPAPVPPPLPGPPEPVPPPIPGPPPEPVPPPEPGAPPEPVAPPIPDPPMPEPPPPAPAALESETAVLVSSLRHELDARGRAEAALRARLIDAEGRLATRVLLEQRTSGTLGELRTELESLRDALARERALRTDAERRAAELDAEHRRRAEAGRGLQVEAQRQAAALDAERALRAEADRRGAEIDVERALRADAERRITDAERRMGELQLELGGQRELSREAYEAIDELRATIEQLSARAAAGEPAPAPTVEPALEAPPEPPPAPEPVAEAHPEPPVIDEPPVPDPASLVDEAPVPEPPAPPAPPAALVEPARLNDALTRLRATITPQEAPAAAGVAGLAEATRPLSLHDVLGRPSLEPSFRKLVRTDAEAAGRLLLELLPLQRVVYPYPVAYDLVLGAGPARRCVCVSVPNGTTNIAVQSTPRPREQVDFQVFGDAARIARLLTAGRFRRRFGLGVARVRGRRDGLVALSALLGTPLDLGDLQRAGVRLDAGTAFSLVAAMVQPAWTAGERFTLAHVEPEAPTTYLVVRDGARMRVGRTAPDGRVTTTVACHADQLLAVLAGEPAEGLAVTGDERPLAALREWIKRAQSE
jgi:hypothetical protein